MIDSLGRRLPSHLNWINYFRAFPWLYRYFDRKVPASAQADDIDPEGVPIVMIACPCGFEPIVPVSKCVECPGDGCGRFYLNAGQRVLCANSPQSEHRVEPGDDTDD